MLEEGRTRVIDVTAIIEECFSESAYGFAA